MKRMILLFILSLFFICSKGWAQRTLSAPRGVNNQKSKSFEWFEWTVKIPQKTAIKKEQIQKRIQARIYLSDLQGVFVGSTQNKAFKVCVHGPTWRKRTGSQKISLSRLHQRLITAGIFGYHNVEDGWDARHIFSKMKTTFTLPSGLKSEKKTYTRPHNKIPGIDAFFWGPEKVMRAWVKDWNRRIAKGLFLTRKLKRKYRLILEKYKAKSLGSSVMWRTYLIWETSALQANGIKGTSVEQDAMTGDLELGVYYTSAGQTKFERVTGNHIGHRIALRLNDEVLMTPVIQARIFAAKSRMTGEGYTLKKLFKLSQRILAALPTPIQLTKPTYLTKSEKGSTHCAHIAQQNNTPINSLVAFKKERKSIQKRYQKAMHCMIKINDKHCIHGALLRWLWLMKRPYYRPNLDKKRALIKEVKADAVERTLLEVLAKSKGFTVTKQRVLSAIRNADMFKEKGKFKPSYVKSMYSNHHITRKQLEGIFRQNLLVKAFKKHMKQNIKLTEKQALKLFLLEKAKRKIFYLSFPVDKKLFSIKSPSKKALTRFMKTEKEAISIYYHSHLSRYIQPTTVRVRHILIKTGVNKKEALLKIQKILNMAKQAPKNFAKLAKQFSEGPTKVKGGDLGFFKKGQMVPPFSRAAFALRTPGELSPVIETVFGFHIIQLVQRNPAKIISLKQAKREIAQVLWRKKQNKNRIVNALTWGLKRWKSHKSTTTFLQGLKEQIAHPTKSRKLPNDVIVFWKKHLPLMKKKTTRYIKKNSWLSIPGLGTPSKELREQWRTLTKASPVLMQPTLHHSRAFLFRLRKIRFPAKSRFFSQKQVITKYQKEKKFLLDFLRLKKTLRQHAKITTFLKSHKGILYESVIFQ